MSSKTVISNAPSVFSESDTALSTTSNNCAETGMGSVDLLRLNLEISLFGSQVDIFWFTASKAESIPSSNFW